MGGGGVREGVGGGTGALDDACVTDVCLTVVELIADEHKSTGSRISFPHGNTCSLYSTEV